MTDTFNLSEIPWQRPVDRALLWSPKELCPLSYLPSFGSLPVAVQLRYNQLFSIGICEQFIWFEGELLTPVLRKVIGKNRRLPSELRGDLQRFAEDEEKHSEMFWRLLKCAEPSFYPERRYKFLNLGYFQRLFLGLMVRYPEKLLVWIWAALFFEERTIDYSRRYREFQRTQPDQIDFLFAQCHIFHLKDEARHHDTDQRLLEFIYDGKPWLKRKVASLMMRILMKAFSAPRRVSYRILEILSAEFPEADPVLMRLREELPLLKNSKPFREMAFGEKSVKTSRRLMKRYPEMAGIL